MTDMLSKADQALWDAGPENQDPLGVILADYFDGYTPEEIRASILPFYTKAVIQALRSPTDEMLLVGARSIGKTMGVANHIERSRPCWQAMIDKALEGKDD